MSNEWYIDRYLDSLEDEEYIEDYQKNFKEDVEQILNKSEVENV